MPQLPHVTITTDGGCFPNPGRGAWAALLRYGSAEKLICDLVPEKRSTNNRAELFAVCYTLGELRRACAVTLRTDSQIVIWALRAASSPKAVARYRRKGKNMDLVEAIWRLAERHRIECEWVKGHSGDPDNERVDRACSELIASNREHPELHPPF
jgi:ribonuclease HI